MKKQERQRNRKIGCILCIIAIIFFVILSISNGLVNKSIYNIIFYILEPLVPVAFVPGIIIIANNNSEY